MITTPKFFKAENNQDGAAEFKRCIPVGVQTSFKTMAPAIATAEQLRLLPYLGQPLFDSAADYYAGETQTDTVMNGLIEHIQMALVRIAFWDSFDQLAVVMTDSGVTNVQGEKSPYRYQADALRRSLQRQGYEWLNRMLEYCTEHVDTITDFLQSPYYTERSESVIKGMADFEKHISINHDFTVFAKLREWIDNAEKMELEFRIGHQMYEAVHATTIDSKFQPLMRGITGFVCHWAMAEATPFLNLQPSANGLVIVSEDTNDGSMIQQAREPQIIAFADRHRTAAERYVGQVVTYCKQHRDTFPEIDELGPSETEHGADRPDNKGKIFLA